MKTKSSILAQAKLFSGLLFALGLWPRIARPVPLPTLAALLLGAFPVGSTLSCCSYYWLNIHAFCLCVQVFTYLALVFVCVWT